MIRRLRASAAPAYLLLCLILGGSAQGLWANAVLRLLAIAIIVWAALEWRDPPRPIRGLLGVCAAAILLGVLQLIPLPPSVWMQLPGRGFVIDGFRLLGLDAQPMTWSLSPHDTIRSLLALLPPLGMIAAMIGLGTYRKDLLAGALIVGALGGILLGILQVSSADAPSSPWYLYRYSNFGVATGFFANGNHMASLLLLTIPFIAALGAAVRSRETTVHNKSVALALVAGATVLIIVGLFLNGSMAGYGLGVPVILASMLLLFARNFRAAKAALAALLAVGLVVAVLLWFGPVRGLSSETAATSLTSRQEITVSSLKLVEQFGLAGSGLGTFEKVYRLNEDPGSVTRTFVNHAHNDYLELLVETGFLGAALVLLFLAWWARSLRRVLKSAVPDPYAQAAAIGSAAILLHSLVDFPLRTAAISVAFAACLVLIVQTRRANERRGGDLRPTRHVVIS